MWNEQKKINKHIFDFTKLTNIEIELKRVLCEGRPAQQKRSKKNWSKCGARVASTSKNINCRKMYKANINRVEMKLKHIKSTRPEEDSAKSAKLPKNGSNKYIDKVKKRRKKRNKCGAYWKSILSPGERSREFVCLFTGANHLAVSEMSSFPASGGNFRARVCWWWYETSDSAEHNVD